MDFVLLPCTLLSLHLGPFCLEPLHTWWFDCFGHHFLAQCCDVVTLVSSSCCSYWTSAGFIFTKQTWEHQLSHGLSLFYRTLIHMHNKHNTRSCCVPGSHCEQHLDNYPPIYWQCVIFLGSWPWCFGQDWSNLKCHCLIRDMATNPSDVQFDKAACACQR